MSPEAIIIIVSLIFSAMFSGIEIAFISGDKLQMELGKDKGLTDRIVAFLANNPTQFIATTLVGNTLSLALYGAYMARILEPVIEAGLPTALNTELTVFLLQIIISTGLVLLTAEFLPKSLFLIAPIRVLKVFAIPMSAVYILLYPFVYFIVALSRLVITRVLRLEFSTTLPAFGLTDLNSYVQRSLTDEEDDDDNEIDVKILHNALEFKTLRVRECMIPRAEIVAVNIEDGIEALNKTFVESGHSKILIYENSIDNILGYCHSLNMFKKPTDIRQILHSLIIVPETMLANELLVQFIRENRGIALVVDEFGGTAGMVTMEDVIEEILGDIQDEHDEEQLLEQKLNEDTYLFSARHEIDYLNDKYNFNLPQGEYETLGGLILSIHKDIPNENDVIEHEDIVFQVVQKENNRIETIKINLV